jgi:ribosomal protein S12 methylthiotransferase
MAQQKRAGKCARLVVTGCLAERYRDELKREIPEIDAVLGTGEVPHILDAIAPRDSRLASRASVAPLTFFRSSGALSPGQPPVASREPLLPTYIYDAETPRLLTTPGHFAYVKIAEGCDYTCAFCIIPTLRGAYRSRTADSIVREARGLAARGVRELLLISQDSTFYGIDRGERGALSRLLRELNTIDGLEWIRLLYLYPTTITDDVLDAMSECEKVCRYVDLPLQHASADVLKRMRRPGNRRTYDKLLGRIRDRVPGVTLRTTLIVGFPGETESDFAQLEAFVSETRFDHVGVFTYSHEEGTRAFNLPDDVPAAVKRRRRNRLMASQKKIVTAMQKARIGTTARVLIDGPSPEHPLVLQGRLEGQAPEIDPVVFLTDCDPDTVAPGQLIETRIVGARNYDLVASPVHELVKS